MPLTKPNRLSRESGGSARQNTEIDPSESVVESRLAWQKPLLVVSTILILSILMSVHLLPDKVSLHLGDVSPREITAPRSVIYVNSVATAQAQQAARLATPPVFDYDERAANAAIRISSELFDRLDRARTRLSASGTGKARDAQMPAVSKSLQGELGTGFTSGEVAELLLLSPGVFQKLKTETLHIVTDAMERDIRDQSDAGITSPDLRHSRLDALDAARDTLSSPTEVKLAAAVIDRALQPNRLLNRRRTDASRDGAVRSVSPIFGRVVRGDVVIGQGEHVTQEQLDKFQGLGMLDPRLEIQTGAAICILAAAMVLLVAAFIRRSLPALYGDIRRLSLLSFIVLLSVLGLKVGATMLGLQFTGGQFGFLAMMSVAAAGMLVSVLLDTNLAVIVAALLSVLSGLIMNHEIRFTVMTLMSSLVGIGSCRTARTRTNLLHTSIALSCANLALVWLMGMLLRDSTSELLTGSYWAVLMGFGATSICWFGVLAVEKPFGILTHQTLLEMSSTDRPLLQQLCAIAPGTYAHSIMVGTLAEAGAAAIGADSLLCRVGGYYHDIGKMKRPEFFVENQRNGNVHGRLSPSLSAIFITAHVRDGLELAREKRLPQEICDIVSSHHGTTLIGYFYHQALTDCGGSDEAPPGLEERFRYPGPKPRTREAAVVMLADSVEAATRCLERPQRERLQAEIARIVSGKIEDGQFDDCPITFKDIKNITDAFVHVLEAMMHGRVVYPTFTQSADNTISDAAGALPQLADPGMSAELPDLEEAEQFLSTGTGGTRTRSDVLFSNNREQRSNQAQAVIRFDEEADEAAYGACTSAPSPAGYPSVETGAVSLIERAVGGQAVEYTSEEYHASRSDQRTKQTGTDEDASKGGQSLAALRAALRRGSKRTADG